MEDSKELSNDLRSPDEAAPLWRKSDKSWTRNDVMLLTLNILVKFGDAVEIYLPGVITQLVSCQMDLTSLEEGFLAVTLYVTMGATIFVTAFLTDRLVNASYQVLYNWCAGFCLR